MLHDTAVRFGTLPYFLKYKVYRLPELVGLVELYVAVVVCTPSCGEQGFLASDGHVGLTGLAATAMNRIGRFTGG